MKISEPCVLDSNILVYVHNQDSPFHQKAISLVERVFAGELDGVLTHQNLLEFYSIVTDKRRVTKPLSANDALVLVKDYLHSSFQILIPTEETATLTVSLCQKTKSRNGEVFDVYLAATMLSHGVTTIITANAKDFSLLPQLRVIDLKEI